MFVFILTFFYSPKVFLLRPVRQATGHSDGSRWRRQWDVLVWGSAVHGVLGFHRQGKSVVLRYGTRTTSVTRYLFLWLSFLISQVWQCPSASASTHKRTQFELLAELEHDSGVREEVPVTNCVKNLFQGELPPPNSYLDFLFITHIQVNTISLNPAGTLLVSGCKDGTGTIWDTSSYTTLQQFHCHDGTIHHMAFSPGMSLRVKV